QTELMDVSKGTQLWGAQYNRRVADLLVVQEDISREISERLRLRLTGEERMHLAKPPTINSEAYQLYLQGRYWWNKRNPEALQKGLQFFQQAVDKDPGYALAYDWTFRLRRTSSSAPLNSIPAIPPRTPNTRHT